MQSYDRFIFESYTFDPKERRIELTYSLDDQITFTERILFHKDTKLEDASKDPSFDRLLFALHLIGGISYYKTCLPKTIEVQSGTLTKAQAQFWNDVYENGLGEFFVKNEIDFRGLIHFPAKATEELTLEKSEAPNIQRVLVPIGGGKDSLVTAELIKASGIRASLFRMGHHPLIETMADAVHLPLITVERHLDGGLFDLNAQGALNGHIPITAYLSFLCVIAARLTGHTAVAISAERSASEGNVELFGKQINHQWSKSLEFEKSFQNYLAKFVGTDVQYFSMLRPLSELHITKLLAEYPQYLQLFTSCNTNWRIVKEKPTERWCNKCPKCAFAFALLSGFVPAEELSAIFGKNLYKEAALLPLYKELLGLEGHKPFECVGTPEETEAAMLLAHDRGDFEGTPVMDLYVKEVRPKRKDPEDMMTSLLTPTAEHAIPKAYHRLIPSN
jgi:UDP-N-acetyl-alpha-D-muramoyl-L-alanyl-L-glutamate epimerase